MKNLLPPLLFVFFLISCKDQELPTNNFLNEPEHSYFPMTVGSYWTYKYTTGSTGSYFENTISVEKDTIIEGLRYSKFNLSYNASSDVFSTFYRNELGEIYNHRNEKIFSSRDFSESIEQILTPPMFETVYHIEKIPVEVSTEIGDFLCLKKIGTIIPTLSVIKEKELHFYYAKGIGLISYQQNVFVTTEEVNQHELIDYHIAPR